MRPASVKHPKVSHLIDEPGDRKTICGLRTDLVPTTWKKNARDQSAGDDPVYPACRACYLSAGLESKLPFLPASLFDSPVSVEPQP